jgi:hypothetical protein
MPGPALQGSVQVRTLSLDSALGLGFHAHAAAAQRPTACVCGALDPEVPASIPSLADCHKPPLP